MAAAPTPVVTTPPPTTTIICASCGASDKSKWHRCSQCKQVRYCNSTCQRQHWFVHKPRCKPDTMLHKIITPAIQAMLAAPSTFAPMTVSMSMPLLEDEDASSSRLTTNALYALVPTNWINAWTLFTKTSSVALSSILIPPPSLSTETSATATITPTTNESDIISLMDMNGRPLPIDTTSLLLIGAPEGRLDPSRQWGHHYGVVTLATWMTWYHEYGLKRTETTKERLIARSIPIIRRAVASGPAQRTRLDLYPNLVEVYQGDSHCSHCLSHPSIHLIVVVVALYQQLIVPTNFQHWDHPQSVHHIRHLTTVSSYHQAMNMLPDHRHLLNGSHIPMVVINISHLHHIYYHVQMLTPFIKLLCSLNNRSW
jgi:hypothetical protein